jgi:hypothetical protein
MTSEAPRSLVEHSATAESPSHDPALIPEEDAAFDRDWYLGAYPDVAAAGVDPFEHYKRYGKGEGRHPTAIAAEVALGFDRDWYLGAYPDVAAAGVDPFEHYRKHGKGEGRYANPAAAKTASGSDAQLFFSPGQLAVLEKSHHYKDPEAAPSIGVSDASPHALSAPSFVSAQYWRNRYRAGGNSGAGSYGRLAAFKAEIINAFVRQHDVASVIEFGCGDGAQLKLADYPAYIGFDVADESVELCRSKFLGDSTKEFKNAASWDYEHADLTLSLDVIFHLERSR